MVLVKQSGSEENEIKEDIILKLTAATKFPKWSLKLQAVQSALLPHCRSVLDLNLLAGREKLAWVLPGYSGFLP